MWKKYINKLANPISAYFDEYGNTIFKNYCLVANSGYLIPKKMLKSEISNVIHYKKGLDKYIHIATFLIVLFTYLMYIHIPFGLWNLLVCEFWGIVLYFACRLFGNYAYGKYLRSKVGQYQVVDFNSPIEPDREFEYRGRFYFKFIIIAFCILLFILPSFALKYFIRAEIKSKYPDYKKEIRLTNLYFSIYPKSKSVYDMQAYAKYMTRDYEGAVNAYKNVLKYSGKVFSQKDYMRLSNLLFLEKKLSSAQEAVETYDKYVAMKRLSITEKEKMLWIKSFFKLENKLSDSISQDYDKLIATLNKKDLKNWFYINSDRAYILYLAQDFPNALEVYNVLIAYANQHPKEYKDELASLYAERGFVKRKLGDNFGANDDFINSGISPVEISEHEPVFTPQGFYSQYK